MQTWGLNQVLQKIVFFVGLQSHFRCLKLLGFKKILRLVLDKLLGRYKTIGFSWLKCSVRFGSNVLFEFVQWTKTLFNHLCFWVNDFELMEQQSQHVSTISRPTTPEDWKKMPGIPSLFPLTSHWLNITTPDPMFSRILKSKMFGYLMLVLCCCGCPQPCTTYSYMIPLVFAMFHSL